MNACLAKLLPLFDSGHTEHVGALLQETTGNRDRAVAVGPGFDDNEDLPAVCAADHFFKIVFKSGKIDPRRCRPAGIGKRIGRLSRAFRVPLSGWCFH
jgi:hypothetical protein